MLSKLLSDFVSVADELYDDRVYSILVASSVACAVLVVAALTVVLVAGPDTQRKCNNHCVEQGYHSGVFEEITCTCLTSVQSEDCHEF